MNFSIIWIFLRIVFILNHSKPSFNERTRKNVKYLTKNSIRLRLLPKVDMPNPVKNSGYIKCYSLSNLRPVKSSTNSGRYNSKKI